MIQVRLILPVCVAAFALFAGVWATGASVDTDLEGFATSVGLAPVPVREGVIMVNMLQNDRKDQPALLLTPAGQRLEKVSPGAAVFLLGPDREPVCLQFAGRLSPDGKRLTGFQYPPISKDKLQNPGPWTLTHLWSFDLESKEGPREPLLPGIKQPSQIYDADAGGEELFSPRVLLLSLAFSGDGGKLYISEVDPAQAVEPVDATKPIPLMSWEYHFQTSRKTKIGLPAGHAIVDASFDGKVLLTHLRKPNEPVPSVGYIVPLDTLKPRQLCTEPFQAMRFSPDGKWVIGVVPRKNEDGRFGAGLAIVSVVNGSKRLISLGKDVATVRRACWSPDGKRIAYEWNEEVPDLNPPVGPDGIPLRRPAGLACRVSVADADGSHEKIILRCDPHRVIHGLDWK